ncbi:hypothetical protein [Ruminococcus sp.]|uniref:hypothetical protein n=1 Tax=Ruminococcus sp. TaxID=41978 RepID=UPI001B67831B|nr:hypothetical protein [Ruminococcus sp.]MBP5432169.1 hypothetical protein [Ruminococcus sp.]
MYDSRTGEIVCDVCGDPIGNINGNGNFFALIRTKYCDNCRTRARRDQVRQAVRDFRDRNQKERKLKDERLKLLEEENELLRERVIELKNNQEVF